MYRIINGKGSTCFEVAKQEVRKKIIKECNQHGWKLQGGAEVKIKRYPDFTWYEIYQTLVEGEQNLTDYDIIEVTSLCDSLSGVTKKMSDKLNAICEEGWRLVGGASVDEEHIAGVSIPSYNIYQTVIKEE